MIDLDTRPTVILAQPDPQSAQMWREAIQTNNPDTRFIDASTVADLSEAVRTTPPPCAILANQELTDGSSDTVFAQMARDELPSIPTVVVSAQLHRGDVEYRQNFIDTYPAVVGYHRIPGPLQSVLSDVNTAISTPPRIQIAR